MPVNDALTPLEASYIATNSYFSLKDWIKGTPTAGIETRANVHNRVLGGGNAGTASQNTSLKGSSLGDADLKRVFSGTTGMGTSSGFGYLLKCKKGDRRHVIIATRGTRPELGAPDLLTDLRAGMTSFGDYGPVHKGFKKTFDSVLLNLAQDHGSVMDADVVHCVGHSLGGGVATLVAAHYARLGKSVKLYTFGCPRVGAFQTYSAMHKALGKSNIYRTAHDLDPVSMIATFPYIHVNPSPRDAQNFTLPSPTGSLFSTANHDMSRYIDSVGFDPSATWGNAGSLAQQVDHDNAVLARWLLHTDNNPGWVRYACAKTLGILFKLFSHVLRATSTAVILGLTAVDLMAEMIHNGLCKAAAFSQQVFQLLRYAATWAGITVQAGADFTVQIIGRILNIMMARLKAMAAHAITRSNLHLVPLPLMIAGGWAISGGLGL
jgi:triacylglycerol lipase